MACYFCTISNHNNGGWFVLILYLVATWKSRNAATEASLQPSGITTLADLYGGGPKFLNRKSLLTQSKVMLPNFSFLCLSYTVSCTVRYTLFFFRNREWHDICKRNSVGTCIFKFSQPSQARCFCMLHLHL